MRTYAERITPESLAEPQPALDALVDVIVRKYAPLPERSLSELINHRRGGVPQWAHWRRDAFGRVKERLAHAEVDGQTYYWPATENPASRRHAPDEVVRLLAPFDPLVWDRRRFEHLWGWAYRFEAYTPAAKRVRGYHALPLLWHEQVIDWGNVSMAGGQMQAGLGYVAGKPPPGAAFSAALDDELQRMATFLQAGASEKGEPLAKNSDGGT